MYRCNCANSFRTDNSNSCNCNPCRTCRDTVFDTTLHMTNHYRRINSVKCVVNTSAPRSYNYRQICCSDKGSTSRLSTPSVLSNYGRVPSRTNSNCDVRRKVHNSLQNISKPGGRSISVPPRSVTRKAGNSRPSTSTQRKTIPQFSKKPNKTAKKPVNSDYKTIDSPKHTLVQEQSVTKPEDLDHEDNTEEQYISSKKPIPTPRSLLQGNVPPPAGIPDYEYLQFSLRITEDIIRNDLYSQREMKRVFNSHVEANRGRLSMTKMLQQIDNLCKELNISKKLSRHVVNRDQFPTSTCRCENYKRNLPTSSKLTPSSKQTLIEKIVNGQYEITDEEIKDFNENELQQVITGLMSDEPADGCSRCGEVSEAVDQILDLSSSTADKYDVPQVSLRSSILSNTKIIEDNSKKTVENVTKFENVAREMSLVDGEENNLSLIVEESSTSNVIKVNSSGTPSDNSIRSSLVTEDKLSVEKSAVEELKNTHTLINVSIKESNSDKNLEKTNLPNKESIFNEVIKKVVPSKESYLDEVLNKADSLITLPTKKSMYDRDIEKTGTLINIPDTIDSNGTLLQEASEDNIIGDGNNSSTRYLAKHKSYDKRSHSLLEAETALKHVLFNLPSWNSAPASYLTDENKDNHIITSTPVELTPNTSDEKIEVTTSNDQITLSSEFVDKIEKNQQSGTSVDKSELLLITETVIIFDSNKNESQNNIIKHKNLDSTVLFNNNEKTKEISNSRRNSISNETTVLPVKEHKTCSSVVPETSALRRYTSCHDICKTHGKQKNEVSINTEYSVADCSTQCELVNMENSLKLGTDKCTQTSLHCQESQHLMSEKYSNTTRAVCSTSELTQPSCTILYQQGIIEHEIIRKDSVNALENNDNDDVYTQESTSIFLENKPVNQENNVVDEIQNSGSNHTNILRNSDPTDDFISTIQQMFLDNMNSLSEIINPSKHSYNKSIAKPSIPKVDYNKYEKQESNRYAVIQSDRRNENSEIFIKSYQPRMTCYDMGLCSQSYCNRIDRNNKLIIPTKENDVSMSDGEISVTSKTCKEKPKVKAKKEIPNYKSYTINSERNVTSKRESKILDRLKKYEHQVVPAHDHFEPKNITLSDYELKMYEQHQQYLPRLQGSFLFPSVGTQTSFTYLHCDSFHSFVRRSSSDKFNTAILFSEGELRSSSTQSDYETKTDISEDQNSSDGKGY